MMIYYQDGPLLKTSSKMDPICWLCKCKFKHKVSSLCVSCLLDYRTRTFLHLRRLIENWISWFVSTRYVDLLLRSINDKRSLDHCGPIAFYATVVFFQGKAAPPLMQIRQLTASISEDDYRTIQLYINYLHSNHIVFENVDAEFDRINDLQGDVPEINAVSDCDIRHILNIEVYRLYFIPLGTLDAIRMYYHALRKARQELSGTETE